MRVCGKDDCQVKGRKESGVMDAATMDKDSELKKGRLGFI